MDPVCDAGPFRYGYAVEVAPNWDRGADRELDHVGLLRFDVARDEVVAWNPGRYRTASEPLFVHAVEGRSDDEGWLLTVVVRRRPGRQRPLRARRLLLRPITLPQAVIHLPEATALPFRSHGTWIDADRYR